MTQKVTEMKPEEKEPQLVKFCLITLESKQQLMDLLRDIPMPRKVSDPVVNALMNAPVGDFDVNKFKEMKAG